MAATLAELVRRFGGEVRGDASRAIAAVAPLERAQAQDLAYVVGVEYRAALNATRAGAVLMSPGLASAFAGTAWLVDEPRLVFAQVASLLHPRPTFAGRVHPSAAVATDAHCAASAYIDAHVVVAAGAHLGERVFVGAGSYIGADVHIGDDTYLAPRVTVLADCRIGARCIFHPGAVIGSDGFGYARAGARWLKIPQLGRVVIGDDVEVGANTTVDRGALGDTVIGNGVKLDNLIQIAHNVQIGDDTAMAACVGVAGSARIGRRCTVGGGAGILGHLEIADDVHITATSLVSKTIDTAGEYSSTVPALPASSWRKTVARLRHLDELARRIKSLEHKISHLIQRKSS